MSAYRGRCPPPCRRSTDRTQRSSPSTKALPNKPKMNAPHRVKTDVKTDKCNTRTLTSQNCP